MFAARFCRCQTVLCIGAAVLTLGTPVRTEPRTNPFHFQVKLSGHSLRPKSKLCHVFQISLRGANLRVFFRTASVLLTVRIRRVASTGEVTPIIGKYVVDKVRDLSLMHDTMSLMFVLSPSHHPRDMVVYSTTARLTLI